MKVNGFSMAGQSGALEFEYPNFVRLISLGDLTYRRLLLLCASVLSLAERFAGLRCVARLLICFFACCVAGALLFFASCVIGARCVARPRVGED